MNGTSSDNPPHSKERHKDINAFVIHEAGGPAVPTFLPRNIGMNDSMIVRFVGYMMEGMDQPRETTQHRSMTLRLKLLLVACMSFA